MSLASNLFFLTPIFKPASEKTSAIFSLSTVEFPLILTTQIRSDMIERIKSTAKNPTKSPVWLSYFLITNGSPIFFFIRTLMPLERAAFFIFL